MQVFFFQNKGKVTPNQLYQHHANISFKASKPEPGITIPSFRNVTIQGKPN
jgi:hypothetical protein